MLLHSDYAQDSGNMDMAQTSKFNNIFMIAVGVIVAALVAAVAMIMAIKKNKYLMIGDRLHE